MAMNVNTVMDGLGVRLDTISGLRVEDYLADSVSPPAAIVDLPENIEFDLTGGRGSDRGTFVVFVLVGKVSERSARDSLAAYMSGTGASSVKQAIEDDETLGGAADTTRVTGVEPSVMTVGGISYLAATFNIDVVA